MKSVPAYGWLPFVLLLGSHTFASDDTCVDEASCVGPEPPCAIYMAPSTIPGAGLGIFTAHELNPGDTVDIGDVVIPLIDMEFYNVPNYFTMMDSYVWDGAEMGMQLESVFDDVTAFAPGLDAAINCHLGLLNVDRGDPVYDDAGLHRSRDPGAGAITPFHNGSTIVKARIPPGGELFKFYGDHWFSSRQNIFGLMPLSVDYKRAERLMAVYSERIEHSQYEYSPELQQDLWDLMIDFPFPGRVLNALPETREDMHHALQHGISSLLQPGAIRSIENLQQVGRCLDNIRPGPSTIPQAGRGAFATRFLPADSIITTSPMLHVPNRLVFKISHRVWNSRRRRFERKYAQTPKNITWQIALNYCWSHSTTSLALCPYGAGVNYINHDSKRPNVKVQWPKDGDFGFDSRWLSKSPADMAWVYKTLFAMDFVALRDIEPGEELFLDYGTEWERAWKKHVQEWDGSKYQNYTSARELNQRAPNSLIRTVDEQIDNPYPDNLHTRCHPHAFQLKPVQRLGADFVWTIEEMGMECQILSRRVLKDGDVVYRIRVRPDTINDASKNEADVEWGKAIDGVPRQAIIFGDTPYTTDIHMREAFRRPIGIPEHMVPQIWKNLEDSPPEERLEFAYE